nr:hypothetical protein [Microbacterium lemovicicum]
MTGLDSKQADAEARLAQLEALDDDHLDVVLVTIAKISQLRAAYPNYYADFSMFTGFMNARIDA